MTKNGCNVTNCAYYKIVLSILPVLKWDDVIDSSCFLNILDSKSKAVAYINILKFFLEI